MTHKTPPPNAKNAKNAKNAQATADNAKNAPAEQAKATMQDQTAVKSQATAKTEPNAAPKTEQNADQKSPEANAATQPAQPAQRDNKPKNPAKRGVQRTVTYIEPISALKMALIFNLALCAVWFVAMALIYIILGAAGTWDRLDSLVGDLTNSSGFSAGMYFGGVVALGLFEVVLFTLLAPIAALIYNASSSILGGVRIQLDR
ncbi:DUF3566 domain-containing protein [Corynebacterium macclintockiae]|uniref:DUF3566 domain-containing protein n=1 Tax=Corynebacterium macclintockiae TaxID=2913501 RepID=UPI003EBE2494